MVKLDDDAKVGLVALICMFALAFTAAYQGLCVNPVAVGAPGYFYVIRGIIGARCPPINCSLLIIAVTLGAYFYI